MMPDTHSPKGRLEEWRPYRPQLLQELLWETQSPKIPNSQPPISTEVSAKSLMCSLSLLLFLRLFPGVLVDTMPKQSSITSLLANKATGQKTPWGPLHVQPAAKPNLGRPPKPRPQQARQQAGPQQECIDLEVHTNGQKQYDVHHTSQSSSSSSSSIVNSSIMKRP